MFKFTILILALLALSASAFRMRSRNFFFNYGFPEDTVKKYNIEEEACQESLCPPDNGDCNSFEVQLCTLRAMTASKFIIIIEI